jgi:hypothetical protein
MNATPGMSICIFPAMEKRMLEKCGKLIRSKQQTRAHALHVSKSQHRYISLSLSVSPFE